jgi:hypothetical protein
MQLPPEKMADAIRNSIRDWVVRRANERWEEEKKKLVDRMDHERDREIAAAVLSVMEVVKFETRDTELVIRVQKVEKEK